MGGISQFGQVLREQGEVGVDAGAVVINFYDIPEAHPGGVQPGEQLGATRGAHAITVEVLQHNALRVFFASSITQIPLIKNSESTLGILYLSGQELQVGRDDVRIVPGDVVETW